MKPARGPRARLFNAAVLVLLVAVTGLGWAHSQQHLQPQYLHRAASPGGGDGPHSAARGPLHPLQLWSDHGLRSWLQQRTQGLRPFSAASPFNTPIPPDPALDHRNESMAAYLGDDTQGSVAAALYDYGVPVYWASDSTPRYRVPCGRLDWGRCPLDGHRVPIPDNARAAPGSDGMLVVIDPEAGESFEFWRFARVNGQPVAGWGDVSRLDGAGTGSTAVGAGVSRLAGLIRVHEIEAGHIPHALVIATNNSCRRIYRPPATKTDGSSSRGDCIPEGARVQLDPAIDLDALPDLTPAERTIAEALQRYGAYNIDNGGARITLMFERPTGYDPYPSRGLGRDHDPLAGIPWDRLRVLKSWNGS